MTNKPDPSAAARLLRALEAPDPLTCDAARPQLGAFAEAEAAGLDVDSSPAFAELLQHLDHCADCAARYAELAADLDTMLNPQRAPMPSLSPAPNFFAPARQSEGVTVRVLGALRRAFQVQLRAHIPAPGVLSGAANLFADTLPEVEGAPLLAVTFEPATAGTQARLLVAVRNPGADTQWDVQLTTAQGSQRAATDAQGVARFAGVALAEGDTIELHCRIIEK